VNASWRLSTIIATVSLVVVLSGCAVHKEMEIVSPGSRLPDSFSVSGSALAADSWWESFNDQQLNGLISEAVAENLTIRQAWARLDQFRALARISGSGKWPLVDAAASAQRTRSGKDGFNPSTFRPDKTIDQYNLSATISYQVDLWNQIDAAARADLFGIEAGRKDVESTAVAIVSSVADLWFSIAEQRAALELLNEQLRVNEEFLSLVELRFAQGAASAVDVFQQRLQVASTRSRIPQEETTLRILEHQLAVLVGKSPKSRIASPGSALPDLPELPDTGIPADLLRKRPDVSAAELRIYAADSRLAVAVADQFPKLSFSASAGGRSNDIGELFDRWFVNLASNLLGPIFDGGRRAAEVDRNRAVVQERLLGWEQAVLTAIREVEDALATEQGQLDTLSAVHEQIDLAEKTLERARSRYINGLSTYLNVLTSLQALQQLERVELQLRRQLLSNRIKLHVALGGHWTEQIQYPDNSSNGELNGE
jgi:NodT family efflux transporter outer membrane factor (OMF) lipoprotein